MAQNVPVDKKQFDKNKIIRQAVNVEITTHLGDQQVFVEKDIISFFINIDKAAFVYVFYQDATGAVFQLMPGKSQVEHYFKPGFYIPFPSEKSSFQFVVQAPFGKEQLWIFASDQGKLRFKSISSVQGIKKLNQSFFELTKYIKQASSKIFSKNKLIIYTREK